RHADFFLALAEEAQPELSGPNQNARHQQLDLEHDNLNAALEYLIEQRDVRKALRLAAALGQFWWTRDYSEGWKQLDRVLRLAALDEPSAVHANVLMWAGM